MPQVMAATFSARVPIPAGDGICLRTSRPRARPANSRGQQSHAAALY